MCSSLLETLFVHVFGEIKTSVMSEWLIMFIISLIENGCEFENEVKGLKNICGHYYVTK